VPTIGESVYRNKRLLEACRQLECMACGTQDGSVCAAHSNSLSDGKGRSLKASDAAVAALCFQCHHKVDQGNKLSREERREIWLAAHIKTMRALFERELVQVKS